jgi:hypothetical protein
LRAPLRLSKRTSGDASHRPSAVRGLGDLAAERLDGEDRSNVLLNELRVREVIDRDHAQLVVAADGDHVADRQVGTASREPQDQAARRQTGAAGTGTRTAVTRAP